MARKSKQKRPGIKEKPKTRDSGSTKPEATVTPIRRKQEPETIGKDTAPKRKSKIDEFIFAQILPHEIEAFIPLITDFYKSIGFEEAAENPMPFIREINRELAQNPYSIFYACVDKELKPQGYWWVRIDKNCLGQNYMTIEHDYVIPEHRGTLLEARIHDRYVRFAVELAERTNTQYVNCVVRTKKLLESRKKLGFEPVEMKMRFTGNATDFKAKNPKFEKYSRYVKEEQDNGRIKTDQQANG